MAHPQESRWLTVEAAAAYLSVHPQTIRNFLHRGDIRATRLSDSSPYLIDRIELDRLLERRKKIVRPYRKGTHPWVAKRHRAA